MRIKDFNIWHYIVTFLLLMSSAYAGGPLSLYNKMPVVYPDGGSALTLNYDQGNLGSRSNATADTLVNQSIAMWNGVSTATITLTQGSDIPADVTTANYSTYSSYGDGINPIIYDSDGSIIDLIFGAGAKSSVLGFAGSAYYTSGANAGKFAEGRAVINGYFSMSDNTMVIVMAHEMGHFIGMDHSQLDNTQGLTSSNFVLMYPQAYRTTTTLHDDDMQAVTALYAAANKDATYGTITGNFQNADTTAKLGVNVWVKEKTSGKVYSCVSDYLTNGDGAFKILVPAGTYTMHAEPVQSGFTGGSRVGPYSSGSGDLSFVDPITAVDFKSGGAAALEFVMTAGCSSDITFKSDGGGTVNTTCVVPVPTADDGTLAVTEDTDASGTLTGASANSGTLSFTLDSNGSKGVVTITDAATGAYSYVPQQDVNGSDSFTFTVTEDDAETSAVATIIVSISAVNDAPVVSAGSLTVYKNTSKSSVVSANDVDGDVLAYSVTAAPSNGAVTIDDAATGTYTYVPGTDYLGSDSFTVKAQDGDGLSDTAVISVEVVVFPVVTLSSDVASPQNQGTSITFSAAANGGGSYEYLFYFKGPSTSGVWTLVQARSAAATWVWSAGGDDVGANSIHAKAYVVGESSTYAVTEASYTIE